MDRTKIHVINKNGDCKVVTKQKYLANKSIINEDSTSDFYFDVDWYQNNGCMTLKQMREKIEDIDNRE